jgi:hypothetical protein
MAEEPSHSQPMPSDGAERSRLVSELRVAEYNSVRTEWLASRDAQQHTLQWTLAALAVLLAGTLSLHARAEQPFLYVALVAVEVAIATFSQAIWFGEVMRMERAALYLRGLEGVARELTPEGEFPPLMWERWRGDPKNREKSLWIAKATPLIVGCFALYGLLAVAGLCILVAAALDPHIRRGDHTFAIVAAATAAALYSWVTAYICLQAWLIKGMSDAPVDLEKIKTEAKEIESNT